MIVNVKMHNINIVFTQSHARLHTHAHVHNSNNNHNNTCTLPVALLTIIDVIVNWARNVQVVTEGAGAVTLPAEAFGHYDYDIRIYVHCSGTNTSGRVPGMDAFCVLLVSML